MSKTVFSFGQRGSCFFECPSQWQFELLPASLEQLFECGDVSSTFCAVLGADESFAISCEGKDGRMHLKSTDLPPNLSKWLYATDSDGSPKRSLQKLRISLGPYNQSYFALDGKSCSWQNLPQELEAAIQANRKPGMEWVSAPRLVELGVGGDFIMITEGDGAVWSLNNYRELDSAIDALWERQGSLKSIHNLCLNAYRLQNFMLQSSSGVTLFGGMASHVEAAATIVSKAIEEDYKAELQARARAQEQEQDHMTFAQLRQLQRLQLSVQHTRPQPNSTQTLNSFSVMLGAFGGIRIGGAISSS